MILQHRLTVIREYHTDGNGKFLYYGKWIAECRYSPIDPHGFSQHCPFRIAHETRGIAIEAANQHAIRMREGR